MNYHQFLVALLTTARDMNNMFMDEHWDIATGQIEAPYKKELDKMMLVTSKLSTELVNYESEEKHDN